MAKAAAVEIVPPWDLSPELARKPSGNESIEALDRESLQHRDAAVWEGQCLAAAIRIVQLDSGLSLHALADVTGIAKTTFYRIALGAPIKPWKAAGIWLRLAEIRGERGKFGAAR